MNEPLVWTVLLAIVTMVIVKRIGALETRIDAISRLDAKLDALLTHAGIRFDPYKDVPPSVVTALEHGQKIEAIKSYRVATGAGLKEAKEFVEEVQRRR